jgi:tyrosyl-tRNA synthetase
MFTFMSVDEIGTLAALEGADIRRAKQVLAYETTRITHGKRAADEAQAATQAAFGSGGDLDGIPTTSVDLERLAKGIPLTALMAETDLVRSRGEARRLIQQGGAYVNDARIKDVNHVVGEVDLTAEGILIRAGKKRYHRLVVG